MKFLRYFFGFNLITISILLCVGANLTSCIKETTTIHDTTTITIRDTITVTDTACHLEMGLVAHYNFTNGSLLDQSGNNNNIVFNNAIATSDRSGVASNAYLFNGSTSYMRVANSTSLNPTKGISLFAVIKVNDFYMGTCHANDIISKGSTESVLGFYVLRIRDPHGSCYDMPDITKEYFVGGYGDNIPQGSAAGVQADTSFVRKGEWYTVVYTDDGHESRMYVNGQLKGVALKSVPFTPNSSDLFIGRNENPSFPYLFNGVIDELRIYNRALCGCEIAQLDNSTNN